MVSVAVGVPIFMGNNLPGGTLSIEAKPANAAAGTAAATPMVVRPVRDLRTRDTSVSGWEDPRARSGRRPRQVLLKFRQGHGRLADAGCRHAGKGSSGERWDARASTRGAATGLAPGRVGTIREQRAVSGCQCQSRRCRLIPLREDSLQCFLAYKRHEDLQRSHAECPSE